MLKLRRVLMTVSDKTQIGELAKAFHKAGTEIVATGKTAELIKAAGIPVRPIEQITGSPEAFQGRMKTLSFQVCSGILYRRGDASDEADLKKLKIEPIDGVVVNFYPFEKAAATPGISDSDLIEQIDIGGPTLVRAAAKNSPDVLVLTDPKSYSQVIKELESQGGVSKDTVKKNALIAWSKIQAYDQAIADKWVGPFFGEGDLLPLRYGENPHQKAALRVNQESPIAWPLLEKDRLTPTELSYNNILDLSSAYQLASDLIEISPDSTGVVIVKHNNPCGVAMVPKARASAQKTALEAAWAGDPVSAFGGVLVFTDPLESEVLEWLADRFVELIAAPDLENVSAVLTKRKNLKAVRILRFGELPTALAVNVPGAKLIQTPDQGLNESLKSVTKVPFPEGLTKLSKFGIACCRSLKSNAIVLAREIPMLSGSFQLVGAGQGQPNRIDAIERLAIPRAKDVLGKSGGQLADCLLISDAFFPFKDAVTSAAAHGIRLIIQPGGSIKDKDSIAAADELGVAMAFSGVRHFRH